MSCGVGCRLSSDPTLLWLWRRPAATAPNGPLAWEPPYAAGAALEMGERQKKPKQNKQKNQKNSAPWTLNSLRTEEYLLVISPKLGPKKHSIPPTAAIGSSSNAASSGKTSLTHPHSQGDSGAASPFSSLFQSCLDTLPFSSSRSKFLEARSPCGYLHESRRRGRLLSTGQGALGDLWGPRSLLSAHSGQHEGLVVWDGSGSDQCPDHCHLFQGHPSSLLTRFPASSLTRPTHPPQSGRGHHLKMPPDHVTPLALNSRVAPHCP